jgi:hypothetical protein
LESLAAARLSVTLGVGRARTDGGAGEARRICGTPSRWGQPDPPPTLFPDRGGPRASDGKGLTRITTNPRGADIPLAYSPDGSHLLLDRADPAREGSTNHALFVTPIGGGDARRITPWGLTDDYASWSPDGRTIVFAQTVLSTA